MIVGKSLLEEDDNRVKMASLSSSRFNNINSNNNVNINDSIIGGKVELDSLRSPHIEQLKLFKEKEKLKLKDRNNTIIQQNNNKQDNHQDEEYNNNNDNNNNHKDTKYHIQRSVRYENIDNNNDNIDDKMMI